MNSPTFIGNVFGITSQNKNSGVGGYVISGDNKKRCSKNSSSPFATFNPCIPRKKK